MLKLLVRNSVHNITETLVIVFHVFGFRRNYWLYFTQEVFKTQIIFDFDISISDRRFDLRWVWYMYFRETSLFRVLLYDLPSLPILIGIIAYKLNVKNRHTSDRTDLTQRAARHSHN